MLKRLKIRNFQIHKKKEIIFTKGVNVIVGETNQGKSAIIRALYLLFENQPRGSEKIFHTKGEKFPLEIEVEDTNGNIIKRKKKKYYLNDTVFKAFNNEVPQPIRELFPLKEINWHKQLDPHFLILSTPGNAAKVLNASTGLEEQEVIIKEIKDRLSETKSEIKHLQTNHDEAKEKVRKLRPVASMLMKAHNIKRMEDNFSHLHQNMTHINTSVDQIKVLTGQMAKASFDQHIANLGLILNLIVDLGNNQDKHKKLVDLLNGMEDTAKTDLTPILTNTNNVLSLFPSLQKNQNSRNTLQQIIEALQTLQKDEKSNNEEIKEKEKEFNNLKKHIGVCDNCPLF